jgi:hypothetical protein
MYDFLMKEMHFSRQVINIGASRFVNNHRQPVCQRMVDSVCRSDAQGGRCYTSLAHLSITSRFISVTVPLNSVLSCTRNVLADFSSSTCAPSLSVSQIARHSSSWTLSQGQSSRKTQFTCNVLAASRPAKIFQYANGNSFKKLPRGSARSEVGRPERGSVK